MTDSVQVYSGEGVDYDDVYNRLPEHLRVAIAMMNDSKWHVDSYEEFEFGDIEGIRLKGIQETNQIAELQQAIQILEGLGEKIRPIMNVIIFVDEHATLFESRRILKVSRLDAGKAVRLSDPITIEITWQYVSK